MTWQEFAAKIGLPASEYYRPQIEEAMANEERRQKLLGNQPGFQSGYDLQGGNSQFNLQQMTNAAAGRIDAPSPQPQQTTSSIFSIGPTEQPRTQPRPQSNQTSPTQTRPVAQDPRLANFLRLMGRNRTSQSRPVDQSNAVLGRLPVYQPRSYFDLDQMYQNPYRSGSNQSSNTPISSPSNPSNVRSEISFGGKNLDQLREEYYKENPSAADRAYSADLVQVPGMPGMYSRSQAAIINWAKTKYGNNQQSNSQQSTPTSVGSYLANSRYKSIW